LLLVAQSIDGGAQSFCVRPVCFHTLHPARSVPAYSPCFGAGDGSLAMRSGASQTVRDIVQ
jgi:hypothetical protein